MSYNVLEAKSLGHILKVSDNIKDKWTRAITKEVIGFFNNYTFDITRGVLPADEVIPVKHAFKNLMLLVVLIHLIVAFAFVVISKSKFKLNTGHLLH